MAIVYQSVFAVVNPLIFKTDLSNNRHLPSLNQLFRAQKAACNGRGSLKALICPSKTGF